MDIAEEAARGFTVGTVDYERGRPAYPAAAVDVLAGELGIGPGRAVLDLAAGTGKFTQLLTARGARVVAVEPVAAMRAALVRAVPAAVPVAGTAEALPLRDAGVDAVTVAQAFHWFRPKEALAEVARVLRPGGGLGMVWNERDESVPWVAQLSAVIDSAGERPYVEDVDWPSTVAATGRFTPLRTHRCAHGHELDADGLVARALSTSYVAVRPDGVKRSVAEAVRRIAADLPPVFALPYVTHTHWCHLA